jgi:hypothetical protein
MAGYTKQDTTGKIANGNIVDADDFNDEFNTLQTAFGSTGGHDHSDTSSGNGAPITKAGADHRYEFGDDALIPKSNFTSIDVGSSTRKFDNAHFGGKVNSATLETTGAATLNSLVVGTSTAVTAVDTDLASVAGTDTTLASAKAIKTYVDAQITAEDLDVTADSGTIDIDLDSEALTIAGGTGITTSAVNSTVTITSDDGNIDHDALNNFLDDEHIGHSGVTITAGNGLTGGGDITATRTLTVDPHTGIAVTTDGVALSHLGLESLTAPADNRIAFWDYDAVAETGTFEWLELGTNLAITGTTLNATDTNDNTTYTAGTGLTLSGTTFNANVDATAQTTAAETVTETASRTYAVQVDGSDSLVVNVPWVDTNTTYTAGTGLTLDGTTFNANVDATTQTVASETVSATASRTYAVQVDSSDNLVVNVPWSTSASSLASYTIDAVDNIILDSNDTQYFKSGGDDVDFSEPMFYFQGNTPTSNGNYPVNIRLYNNSPNPADNRDLGHIGWYMDNSAGSERVFVWMDAKATDYTNGSMDAELKINIRSNDSALTVFEAEGGAVGGDTYIRSADDIYLRQGGNDIYFGNAVNANEAEIRFELAPFATEKAVIHCSAPLHVQPTGKLNLSPTTGETVFLGPSSNTPVDIEIRNPDQTPTDGDILGKIRFTGEDSANSSIDYVTLEASIADASAATQDGKFKINLYSGGFENTVFEGNSTTGHTIVSAGNDIYLKPKSDDVYLQGLSGASAQVRFGLSGSSAQTLEASGVLYLRAGGSLNSTFTGANLAVSGALSKGSGSFKIDHPLPAKADTHHLVHSFIEGPQADLIYRGRVTLVDSTATVDIDIAAGMTDGTFVALCEDVQCFTSNESGWAAVKGSVSGNTLTITAQDNACTDTISWMVVGERKDPHMLDAATDWTDSQGKVIVEPAKSAE